MTKRRASTSVIAFAALLAVGLAVYFPAIGNGFIADDFINLHFVRSYHGSWWAFLDPSAMYSDPVTATRYKPGYVFYFWLLDSLMGDHAAAYHVLSIVLQAGVSVAVLALSYRLFGDRVQSIAAAVLFTTSRAQVQMIAWVSANYRLTSTGLALAAILVLWGKRRALSIATSVGLFAVALSLNPELIVLPAVLGAIALCHPRTPAADPELARRAFLALAFDVPVAAVFVYANRLSNARFPELPITPTPDPSRVLLFLANAFVPFELPLWFKVACVAAIFVGTLRTRDPSVAALLFGMLCSALFWGMLRGYPLAPRYLYLATAFGSIVVARMLGLVAARITARPIRIVTLPRQRGVVLCALCGPLVLASIVAIRSSDLVLLDYLSVLGARLTDVQREARAHGSRVRVFVRPSSNLSDGDLEYFVREIEFVRSPGAAQLIIDTDVERYRRQLGPGLAGAYWFLPWFQIEANGGSDGADR